MARTLQIVGSVLAIGGGLIGLFGVYFEHELTLRALRVPDRSHSIPLRLKGLVFFVTRADALWHRIILDSFFSCVVLSALFWLCFFYFRHKKK